VRINRSSSVFSSVEWICFFGEVDEDHLTSGLELDSGGPVARQCRQISLEQTRRRPALPLGQRIDQNSNRRPLSRTHRRAATPKEKQSENRLELSRPRERQLPSLPRKCACRPEEADHVSVKGVRNTSSVTVLQKWRMTIRIAFHYESIV
jgi:hypothetical protein